jgi:hypothetical protein
MGVVPGGPLLGSEASEPVRDWSFSDAYPLIAVETRGRFFRHSVTVLCVSYGGDLYLMARHAPRKRWVQEMMRDPRIRVRIGDTIYPGRAVRVTEPLPDHPVARAVLRKYVAIEAEHVRALPETPGSEEERAEVWTFRVTWDGEA